jgi:tryptophan 2,3-dioxygenase
MMSKENDISIDISDEKIHWKQDFSYSQYLALDNLLELQNRRSDQHDEMLFIIIHQASELWIKLCLHEAHGATRLIIADNLRPAFKMLTRVVRIQEQLINSWGILATMTPTDYISFRPALGQSSGFQSHQYRELEFLLGNKNAQMLEAHVDHPANLEHLQKILQQPSLYDTCLQLLSKRGFAIPASHQQRDWSQPYTTNIAVEQAWSTIYSQTEKYWDLYELAEKLVDVEYKFQQWRFNHMKTVERIIGYKRGTGGTQGVHYLQKALALQFFPELWSVRTAI